VSEDDSILAKLLAALEDSYVSVVEALNAHLEAKAPREIRAEGISELFPGDLRGLLRGNKQGARDLLEGSVFLPKQEREDR